MTTTPETGIKEVYTETADLMLSSLKEMFDSGDIIPQPDYQRDYVWKDNAASSLIESIIIGIPIPTIYLCQEDDNTLSIIDGQQRATSIVRYLKNEFKLKGLQERADLNGKKYIDLDKDLQRKLKSSSIRVITIKKESQELKYEIFARLNKGAIKLKPQELRNCIYRGKFNEMLNDIAQSNKNLKVLFVSENNRKTWQENILRFFALSNFHEYKSSIGKTLNDFMFKHQNDDDKTLNELKKKFNSTIDIIKQVIGDDAFCAYDRVNDEITNKFSGSVYDSIIIPFSLFDNHALIQNADEIRKQINELKKNNELYHDYTYAATGSKERVVGRIMMVYDLLSKITGKFSSSGIARTFSETVKDKLWHEGYVCPYCKQEILKKEDAEVDHIVPFSASWDTSLENAQLLHRICNRIKSNNQTDEFEIEEE